MGRALAHLCPLTPINKDTFMAIFSLFLFLFFFIIAGTTAVWGHGGTLKTLEATFGSHRVTMNILPDEVIAGEETTFSFLLVDAASGSEVMYSDTFVRLDRGSETVYAGTLSAGEFGGSRMTIRLPKDGSHTAYVRFYAEPGGATIVEGQLPSFDVSAPTASSSQRRSGGAALIAGLLGGVALGFLGASMRKRKSVSVAS